MPPRELLMSPAVTRFRKYRALITGVRFALITLALLALFAWGVLRT